MSDLTQDEQKNVRSALQFLRIRFGNSFLLAKALKAQASTVRGMTNGGNSVSAAIMVRVARLAGVGIDDLLAGKYPIPGMCPHCGRGPV